MDSTPKDAGAQRRRSRMQLACAAALAFAAPLASATDAAPPANPPAASTAAPAASSTPAADSASPAAAVPSASTDASASTPAAQPAADSREERLRRARVFAQRYGYVVEEQRGDVVLCKATAQTGSRVRGSKRCVSEEQARTEQESAEAYLDKLNRGSTPREP